MPRAKREIAAGADASANDAEVGANASVDESDDAIESEFMDEWEAMREKLAGIPDDIGPKLDAILAQSKGESSNVASNTPTAQPSAAPQTPSGANPAATPERAGAPAPERKPKSNHWYFGEPKWRRNR